MGSARSSGAARLACAAGLLLGALRASAAEPHAPGAEAQLIVIDRGNPVLARKIQAEGAYAGFGFIDPSRLGGARPDAQQLSRIGAAAAIEVSSDEQVELVVSSGGSESARLFFVRRAGEAEAFPLRVIEQLRARLLDLGWAVPEELAAAPKADLATTAEAPALAPSGLPAAPAPELDTPEHVAGLSTGPGSLRVWLNGGFGVLEAVGGVGLSSHGVLGAQLGWGDRWGVGALALLPLNDNEVRKPEGEADVSVSLYLLQLSYSRPLGASWLWSLALGPGLVVLPLSAEARAPLVGKSDRLVAGVGEAELSVARELTGWLRLRASLLAGLSAPRPVLSFAGQEAAAWGRWFGALGLRAEVGLPPGAEAAP